MDDYDALIDNAERNGYYDQIIRFMRVFMGSVLKTNDYEEFGVLMGVQRISRDDLFSSINNHVAFGVLDDTYSTSFGYTEDEVKAACERFDVSNKYDEIKTWYGSYRFGGSDMYNP